MNWSSGLGTLLGTSSGRAYAESQGYGFVIQSPGQFYCTTPRLWFIYDEPDHTDANVTGLPADGSHNPGVMAMQMLQNGEALRTNYTLAPTTINLGGKSKPYNDWNWGQVPDVFMNDCYYETLLAACITFDPTPMLLFQKPTYTYASAQVTALACEPNPMHMILYSTLVSRLGHELLLALCAARGQANRGVLRPGRGREGDGVLVVSTRSDVQRFRLRHCRRFGAVEGDRVAGGGNQDGPAAAGDQSSG